METIEVFLVLIELILVLRVNILNFTNIKFMIVQVFFLCDVSWS